MRSRGVWLNWALLELLASMTEEELDALIDDHQADSESLQNDTPNGGITKNDN